MNFPVEPRAMGGQVQAGKPYVVGEQGPEIMVPNQSGNIVSNPSTPGGYTWENAIIDNNPIKGAEVNIVGMTNLFQAVVDNKIHRMVFPSSQSVYGTSSSVFNDQPVKEEDYCGLQHQLFTYAVMKLLNEFMAQKYMALHNISIACTRPSVVFGFGRKRSSLMWAEEFATNPALGKSVHLPFPETNKDNYIYVDEEKISDDELAKHNKNWLMEYMVQ